MNERIVDDDGEELIAGEILHGPFANPQLNKILKRFGKVAFGRSSACMEFEDFLRRVLKRDRGFKMDTCLEVGTFHGITAIVLSQYFNRVLCVSVDDMPVMKRELIEFLGIRNIAFYDATNNEDKAAFINRAQFDFCYQDGDHTHDTYTDFELVKKCGRVLFHEYWPLQPPVWNLVNSLPQEEVTRAYYDCFAYWEKR